MKTNHHQFSFSKSLLALAVLAAYAPAYADDAEIKQLTQPESSISVGVGAVSGEQKDRTIFGQYNGLREDSNLPQVDVDINKRDEASGTSIILKGNDLGLDSRDLSVSYEKQGDWKVGADYSELVRHELRTVNTGLLGVGTTTPTVVRLALPGTGQDHDLKFKRVGMGLSGEKWFSKSLQLEVALRNEDKTGARTFGIGYACAAFVCGNATNTQTATNQTWALLMLPEPVDSATRQIEAKLNFNAEKLNISTGYYGSFFTNGYGSLKATVPNSLNNPLGAASTLAAAKAGGTSLQNIMQLPVALQPDNQAHQFYVSGSYRFTPTINSTFKYAYTHATQDEDYAASGLTNAPAGVTNLGGIVDTNLLQLGLTARPLPKLSLLANLRYEDKDDKTPHVQYNVDNTTFWDNYHINSTKLVGKLEASYQLPADLRGTVGLDYSSHDRPVPISITEEELGGLGALRAKNQETGYRLELRRTMSETLTGALGYTSSKRTGSDWTSLSTGTSAVAIRLRNAGLDYGQTGSADAFLAQNPGNAFPLSMVDIDREKLKLSANWTPTEQLEVQFNVEDGKDKNANPFNPIALGKGWRESSTTQYSLDASFALSEKWKFNGYASQGNQNLKINHSTGYMADLNTRSDGLGFGVSGKVSAQLEVGAQVSYFNDTTKYGLAASSTVAGNPPNITAVAPSAGNLNQVAIGLPDVHFQSASLSLFGKYALRKNADIRVSLVHQRAEFNEWSWANNGRSFVYQDNTSLSMNPEQSLTAIGVAYIYKFQ